MTRKMLERTPSKNQVVKPVAIQVATPQPLSTALEGVIVEPEGFQPIPHNDQKAIGDAVNHLLENQPEDHSEKVEELEARISQLEATVTELDGKMSRLIEAWGDPDESTAEKGGEGAGGDADKH